MEMSYSVPRRLSDAFSWTESAPFYWRSSKPISSIAAMEMILSCAEERMAVEKSKPNFMLLFRGQADSSNLAPKFMDGCIDLENMECALREMTTVCKEALGDSYTDNEVYFIMRHAGLPSHLLDWSYNWKVALWFALHNPDGTLTDRPSSLWALRLKLSDMESTFFPADQHTCDRSEAQEGWAYKIRFEKRTDGVHVLPMEQDPYYSERLLKIQLNPAAHESMLYELMKMDQSIEEKMKTPSPLPNAVVEKCRSVFRNKVVTL